MYDHDTLYIPDDELSRMTPVMQQYWRIKSENYQKIVIFQLGKFYELFYNDAIIGHRVLDLNWMGKPENLHVGFMQSSKDRYAGLLVQGGY